MRAKCLAQEHNTMTRPGLEPGTLDPESSALTTRPPRLPHMTNPSDPQLVRKNNRQKEKSFFRVAYGFYLLSIHVFPLLPFSIFHCHSIVQLNIYRGVQVLVAVLCGVLKGHVRFHTGHIVKIRRAPINVNSFEFPVYRMFLWTKNGKKSNRL